MLSFLAVSLWRGELASLQLTGWLGGIELAPRSVSAVGALLAFIPAGLFAVAFQLAWTVGALWFLARKTPLGAWRLGVFGRESGPAEAE